MPHPDTELSPWLKAERAMSVYCASVHPGKSFITEARPTWTARTPSSTLSVGLNTDVAHNAVVSLRSRLGCPLGKRAFLSQPHAGVSCMRPNDFDSSVVQPIFVPHGASGLIAMTSNADSSETCALKIIASGSEAACVRLM